LRQRKEDIPVLSNYFLKLICERENLGERRLLKSTIKELKGYKWPGNIRELRHVIERAAILGDSYYIKPQHLGLPSVKGPSLNELEEKEIKRILQEFDGDITKAAKSLGISRATLYRRLSKNK
jgi:DNA-binding NtrC family response regulator